MSSKQKNKAQQSKRNKYLAVSLATVLMIGIAVFGVMYIPNKNLGTEKNNEQASVIKKGIKSANNMDKQSSQDAKHALDMVATIVKEQNIAVSLFKSPTCGCCELYLKEMQKAGIEVKVNNLKNMTALKDTLGLPVATRSCHTVMYGDLFAEGHLPFEPVLELLSIQNLDQSQEQGKIDGIALPGMPSGSIGMPGRKLAKFDVVAIYDGHASPYASY